MRNLVLIFLVSFFSVGIFSCSIIEKKEKKANTIQGADKLYEKYKNMVSEGDGCVACVDCAALALAISYDTKNEIKESKAKLMNYYKQNGTIPCPELIPELNKEIALIAESE
ncbi:MAG: hypothetical protein ABFS35_04205 [Bacteroidota bacterium]